MKSMKWALVAVVTAVATPALAAVDGDKNSPAVWIALAVVFMGAFIAIFTSQLAIKVKKKKQSDGE